LGQPASEYQFLGYDASSAISGNIPHRTGVIGEGLRTTVLDGEPFTPTLSSKPELLLFVGYPSMGKSTLYRKHFGPAGYERVSQDVLGNKTKCTKATEEALAKGKSCVIGTCDVSLPEPLALLLITPHPDNTNRDGKTRKDYIDIAKKFSVPVR